MNVSVEGVEFIEQHEGLRLVAYQDGGGIWTIGYGHTKGVYEGQEITEEEADALLVEDLRAVEHCINANVTRGLTQKQYNAVGSFALNLGCTALRNSTLLRKLNAYDDVGAAKEFGRWNHIGSVVVAGLTKRRADEMELFLS